MTVPFTPERHEYEEVLARVVSEARDYLAGLDERLVRSPNHEAAARAFGGPLPEEGVGAAKAITELLERAPDAAVHTAGPRFFHFVVGGSTPAALGADWLASTLDQVAYAWVSSPLAVRLEMVSLDWLKQLFALPSAWSGVFTTGATMANFVGLAAARQWWGREQGVDVAEAGLSGLPPVPVFSSGHIHPSALKALAMLGIGRGAVRISSRDDRGRLDIDDLEAGLRARGGAPSIVVANAGEVNAGDFDPIEKMADLAARHNAWLHVDAAFGLFARVSPRTAALTRGVERARSVTVAGHKWLNVPYDCGFSFVDDHELMAQAFAYSAAYLPGPDDPQPNFGAIGPESSRRARSLAVWATLRPYGRNGYRALVETHLDRAGQLADLVDAADDLERLADVPLNIVCFRYNPGGRSEADLNELNDRLGAALLNDGRYYAGTARFGSRVALRPAMSNWRIRPEDVAGFVDVVRELGARLA